MARKSFRGSNIIDLFEAQAQIANSPKDLEKFLYLQARPARYIAFRTKLVYLRNEFDFAISRWFRRNKQLHIYNRNTLTFKIEHPDDQKQKRRLERRRSGVFALLPSTQRGIYRLTTVSYSTYWHASVRRFVKRAYPYLVPIFFEQKEFREALLVFERDLSNQFRLIITEVGLKEPRPGQPASKQPIRYDTDRKWTKARLTDLFAQAEERNQWFTSIGFMLISRSRKNRTRYSAKGRLYKSGELFVDFLFQEVAEALLPRLEAYASDRISLLRNRGLEERNLEPAHPIEVTYPINVFDDPNELREFNKVIAQFPNATKAVFHSNPYFHASVADFTDGSSIDIWILSPKRILLVPQARSSESAFSRLISYIFDKYREGTVSEYSGEE